MFFLCFDFLRISTRDLRWTQAWSFKNLVNKPLFVSTEFEECACNSNSSCMNGVRKKKTNTLTISLLSRILEFLLFTHLSPWSVCFGMLPLQADSRCDFLSWRSHIAKTMSLSLYACTCFSVLLKCLYHASVQELVLFASSAWDEPACKSESHFWEQNGIRDISWYVNQKGLLPLTACTPADQAAWRQVMAP